MAVSALMELLNRADVPVAQVNQLTDVLEHPQLVDRGRWRWVDTEAGPVSSLLPPAIFDGFEPVMTAVPALGQATAAILDELGVDPSQAKLWRDQAVVG